MKKVINCNYCNKLYECDANYDKEKYENCKKRKNVGKVLNAILFIKKNIAHEKDWVRRTFLFDIIEEVTPYSTDKERVEIAIEVSTILGKEYDIYGCD